MLLNKLNFRDNKSNMTVQNYLDDTKIKLSESGIDSARLDSLILLEYVSATPRSWLLAHPDHQISTLDAKRVYELVERRLLREPIAYIIGYCDFFDLKLTVSNSTLIPRPETEDLVTAAMSVCPVKANILEIGTGSGAISLAIRSNRADIHIVATDINPQALEVAKTNAIKYSMDDITFKLSNLMDDIDGLYDVIVANLPYLDIESVSHQNEISYEPIEALYSSDAGRGHYKRLIKQLDATPHLINGGALILELEPSQRDALVKFAMKYGFNEIKIPNVNKFTLVLKLNK